MKLNILAKMTPNMAKLPYSLIVHTISRHNILNLILYGLSNSQYKVTMWAQLGIVITFIYVSHYIGEEYTRSYKSFKS